MKMIPPEVMAEAREEAARADLQGRIQTQAGFVIVITIWLLGFSLLLVVVYQHVRK